MNVIEEMRSAAGGEGQGASRRIPSGVRRAPAYYAALGGLMAAGLAVSGPNPCAVKRTSGPCAPRAAQTACAPRNPCAAKRACAPCRACDPCAPMAACGACAPCAACAPCGPCGPCGPCAAEIDGDDFTRPAGFCGPTHEVTSELLEEGERLWNDPTLGDAGLSCQSCHMGGANFSASFAEPYPHRVAMPLQMGGVEQVHADEMVQFCMLAPMESEPLPWESRELAALTAHTLALQEEFDPACAPAADPCAPCAPCAPGCAPCAPGCAPCAPRGCGPCAPRGCAPCNPCAASDTGATRADAAMNPMPVPRPAG